MMMPEQHDPLCPFLERRATCQCDLIAKVEARTEDRMYEEWRDADAYNAAGLTT